MTAPWMEQLAELARRARASRVALKAAHRTFAQQGAEAATPWLVVFDQAREDQAVLCGYRRALVDAGLLSVRESTAWEQYVHDDHADAVPNPECGRPHVESPPLQNRSA